MSLTAAPLEEGLAFDTGPESAHAVQDYALAHHKSVCVERASGSDRRMACSSEAPCGFFVQIYRQRMADRRTYGKWYIASLNLTHSEGCTSVRRLSTRQIAGLPAFVQAVQTNPKASIESLMALVLQRHGVSLEKHLRLVYRARDLVRSGKVVKSHLLSSQDEPLPERQFVRCRAMSKKGLPDPNMLKSAGRMMWTNILIESLLIQRLVKYRRQFDETVEQSRHRELWKNIENEFNAMHDETVTVLQLRSKFKYLQDQYLKIRAEEEATHDSNKLVIYPHYWDLLAEYFGDEVSHHSQSVDEDNENIALTEMNGGETPNLMNELDTQRSGQLGPYVPPSNENTQIQPSLYPIPTQTVSQTQFPVTELETMTDGPTKRRKVNTSIDLPSPTIGILKEVSQSLKTFQSVQRNIAQSVEDMKQVLEQSNEAIRGLHHALNQSIQVNAALLDFLKRQSST